MLIVIEPSMGFGTGHHATTRLCLRLVSGLDLRGARVVDLGTGSGVLAMAAALSGAAAVEALDVDPDAIQSAEASAALNDLPPVVRFTVGDFRTSPPAAADVVLANLTGGMLRSTAETLWSIVAPGGTLVASGFDTTEAPAVLAALAPGDVAERLDEDGWVGVRLTFER
jgi:ribosomal protein L11 methyltransferase